MSLFYHKVDSFIVISGNTYPVKEKIKSIGGRFQGTNKTWVVMDNGSNEEFIHNLCIESGGGPLNKNPESSKINQPTGGVLKPKETTNETVFSKETPKGILVSELVNEIQGLIGSRFTTPIWIIGEIQNVSRKKGGLFFKFSEPKKDPTDPATIEISACLWQSTQRSIQSAFKENTVNTLFQDGIKARLLCQVNLYKDRGQLSLTVLNIDPSFTQGELALQRERLLKELRSKGLDITNKNKELATFPLKIGLISAENSRAKSDFLHQLETYKYPGDVIFFPAGMQGKAPLKEVVAGIKALSEISCDLIVITRGGGSAADLRWFDSREIAYAIAQCKIPIVAAIGHHEDICIAEEICYQREKTPTAAADFIIHLVQSVKDRIKRNIDQIDIYIRKRIEEANNRHSILRDRLIGASQNQLLLKEKRLTNFNEKIALTSYNHLNRTESLLSHFSSELFRHSHTHIEQQRNKRETYAHKLKEGSLLQLERAKNKNKQQMGEITHILKQKITQIEPQITILTNKIKYNVVNNINQKEITLHNLKEKISSLNPQPWLKNGWTRLTVRNKVVSSPQDLKLKDTIKVKLKGATVTLKVEAIDI